MRHVLSALVQNVPGVLSHVAGMLASRGYNIDSLAVGTTESPALSRMTFVVVGDEGVMGLHLKAQSREPIIDALLCVGRGLLAEPTVLRGNVGKSEVSSALKGVAQMLQSNLHIVGEVEGAARHDQIESSSGLTRGRDRFVDVVAR